jgi:hypothetical protein
LRHVFPGDTAAQYGRPIEHVLPGRSQNSGVIDTFQHEGNLLEVNALVALRQPVKYHSGLHRRERIDVLHGAPVAHQPVHRGLVEASEWKV